MLDESPLPTFVKDAFIAGALAALQELYLLEGEASGFRLQASGGWERERGAVVAEIQLSREPAGALRVVAPVEVARRLAERYLPAGTDLTDELLDDCLGELANVIAGQAKTALKGTPYHFMLTTPVVTRNAIAPIGEPRVWRCSITSEAGAFAIVVDLPLGT